jgi:hypothetical protein
MTIDERTAIYKGIEENKVIQKRIGDIWIDTGLNNANSMHYLSCLMGKYTFRVKPQPMPKRIPLTQSDMPIVGAIRFYNSWYTYKSFDDKFVCLDDESITYGRLMEQEADIYDAHTGKIMKAYKEVTE